MKAKTVDRLVKVGGLGLAVYFVLAVLATLTIVGLIIAALIKFVF